MIVRSLLIAGFAGTFLIAACPVLAQYIPLGPAMNAVRSAQPAPSPGMQAQQPSGERRKGVVTRPRTTGPQPYSDRPARKKNPVNRSQDNG